jgi:hypothetical protein
MRIISATYGGVDVKSIVESKIKGDALVLRSSNSIFGDTSVGHIKYLQIEAELGGEIYKENVREGGVCVIPKSKTDRLGIFYSNNVNPQTQPTIKRVLKQLQKASDGVADIYTCMWRGQEGNPFKEYIAWTQTLSHLNQLLQIMQLLYTAREVHQYKYVSFLEHDVLYAEGYFEFPDFERGEILTNMNYIGMNTEGFQPLGQRDEPFHQMTMRFEDAIEHCERILANALITNSGMIEPQDMVRKQWESMHSNIHVNHGHHFTSHYNVFKRDSYFNLAPYWGNHNDWKDVFPQ